MKYKIMIDSFGNQIIFDNETKENIPIDENNTEYQAYLAWVALGNEADVEEI